MTNNPTRPVFRFAPSPNGPLHLGHALSAILNHDMAHRSGGRFLVRIEDIDPVRSTTQHQSWIFEDLAWLGLAWEAPVRRQSDHIDDYRKALKLLQARGLVYPAFLSRAEVKKRVAACELSGQVWLRDPEGVPLYPDDDRTRTFDEAREMMTSGCRHVWRLDMKRAIAAAPAPLGWLETGQGAHHRVAAQPALWGDVVLWRSDAPSSYHLSVVVDDALQGISHAVRGRDLYQSTAVHRLLQTLLGLDEPTYHHHRLIVGPDGRKLSKSLAATGLRALRERGVRPSDIRNLVGL